MSGLESAVCPVCVSDSFECAFTLYLDPVRSQIFNSFRDTTVRWGFCRNCGFTYQSPRMTEQAVAEHYRKGFWETNFWETSFESEYRDQERHASQSERYKFIQSGITSEAANGHRRALDIGCGTGNFLDFLHAKGYETYAVEPCEAFHGPLSARHKVVSKFYSGASGEAGTRFPLITSCHVMEYVYDLRTFADHLSEDMEDGGLLYLELPNIYNLWGDLRTNAFGSRNLWAFTVSGLDRLLRQHGFSLVNYSIETPHGMKTLFRKGGAAPAVNLPAQDSDIRTLLANQHRQWLLKTGWKCYTKEILPAVGHFLRR